MNDSYLAQLLTLNLAKIHLENLFIQNLLVNKILVKPNLLACAQNFTVLQTGGGEREKEVPPPQTVKSVHRLSFARIGNFCFWSKTAPQDDARS